MREPQNSWEISYVLLMAGRYRGDDITLKDIVKVIDENRRKQLRIWMGKGFNQQWLKEHR